MSSLENIFFPGQLAYCKKAVERVNSEKNILNSSVECGVEWFFFRKSHMYVHHQIRLNELINMMYFIIKFERIFISRVIDENVRKMAKNADLKTRIYGSKNISSCRE